MPPFEGMSPAQEAPKKNLAKETIDVSLIKARKDSYSAEQQKLAALIEADRLGDELRANRLAELIRSGDMAGVAELTKDGFGTEDSYTQGNAEQKRHSGELNLPPDDNEKMQDRNSERLISNLIQSSLSESPKREVPDDEEIDDAFNNIKAA